MPSTFSFATCTALFSSILMSLSLHLPSDPPPYNHTQPSHGDYSLRKNKRCQNLLIPATSSVLIHIPNSISYHDDIPRSTHRRKRKAQSIPMVEITHHKAVEQLTPNRQLVNGQRIVTKNSVGH
ncbi:uncharacterized protein EDB91DRAFT_442150 [Suillus paluster]|uniref:uncharacterized protein n=1 Tax=Suillus paluster TaxID=48578 RepID=UPI001B85E323|nr:uncharacterized protein EDB91DRAFT_442150 [Suillus paluster]KAG1738931.1 hypothetical protein EDB91DRAFT_442150 [Suillus paluster]